MVDREALAQEAAAFGEQVKAQFGAIHGEVTAAALDVIAMLVDLQTLYLEARGDLQKQGLRESYNVSNYKKGTRENKALAPLLKLQTQKARLLRELRLLPGSRKAAAPDEDGDAANELDDY